MPGNRVKSECKSGKDGAGTGVRSAHRAILGRAVALVCAWLCATTDASGQELKGGVRGKVVDPDFGNAPIPNAAVVLEGAGLGTQSAADGSFTISGVTPGNYELSASREGYNRVRISSVIVPSGGFAERTLEMIGQVTELEDFVVTSEDLVGTSQFQLDIQQSLTSFANVLGGDFINKIGASNVGQALQKVAGVSVVGDRYVLVRGLADRYNAVLLNNLPIPSSDPDRRAVNLDLFPGSIVGSLQTSKTFTPDLPGEATGGSINIVTRSVPEQDFTKAKVGLGFDTLATGNSRFLTYPGGGTGALGTLNERRIPAFIQNAALSQFIAPGAAQREDQAFRDKVNNAIPRTMGTVEKAPPPDFQFESNIGRRFEYFGKPAGLLLGIDYRKQYRFDPDGFEGRYSFGANGNAALAFRRAQVMRGTASLRASLLAVLGVQPQPGDEVKMTIFTNVSAQDRASLRFGPRDTVPIGPVPEGTDNLYRESLAYTERRLHVLQLSGRHHWNLGAGAEEAVLKWSASYNRSTQDEPDHRFTSSDVTPDRSRFFFPGALPIPPVRRYWRELDDDRYNFGADYEVPLFHEAAKKSRLKFGGLFDLATRDYRADNFAYNISEENNVFPSRFKDRPYPGATLGDVFNYGNRLNVDQPFPNLGHYLFRFTPPETYDAFQAIPAGYAMIEADLTDQLQATFGLRFEQTNIDIEAADISQIEEGLGIFFLAPEERTPENINDLLAGGERARNNPVIQAARLARLNETHVLPSFTLKYKLAETMNLRGSFARTIARPSFKELAPVLFRDAETGDFFAGNQRLKTSDIDNYDLRLEWFPKSGGTVALSLFSKAISDPIEKGIDGVERFFNGNDAVIYGAEIEFDKDLSFLAEPLRGLSIGANYAYLRSVAPRESESVFSDTRRLQGQPDYILNFNLGFDKPEFFGLSSGLLLNVTGIYLDTVGAQQVADIFVEPLTTLNAFVSFKTGKNGKLTFRASNLTSPELRRVYDNGDRNIYDSTNTSTTYSVTFEMEL